MYSIVIADDEQRICDAIKAVVVSAIQDVEIAGIFYDGDELYQYLSENTVNIVLMDIEMPGKSGLEIAKLLEEQGHRSYVIIITAFHEFEYARQAIAYRVDAFLTKPFSSRQLAEEIKKGVEYFREQESSAVEKWTVYRNLFRVLCVSKADIFPYGEIRLCRDTISLKELACTELLIRFPEHTSLLQEWMDGFEKDLILYGECDLLGQSVFFLEIREDAAVFLAFTKEDTELRLATLPEILRVVKQYTGKQPVHSAKTFPSFSSYLTYLGYAKEMEEFLDVLTEGGAGQAENGIRMVKMANQPPENGSGNYLVDVAKEYVQKNYASSMLSLQSAADSLSVSSGYLSRIFKNKTGQNFSEYLMAVRMGRALYLLKTTNLSTNEISLAVGYGNPTYFRTSFKACFGITPRQYRYNQIGGKELEEE